MSEPKADERTWDERVAGAAALLQLGGGAEHLLAAVSDCGLTLVVSEDAPPVLTEDASFDAELQALVAIASTLGPLDPEARKRVVRWAIARYLPAWKLTQW